MDTRIDAPIERGNIRVVSWNANNSLRGKLPALLEYLQRARCDCASIQEPTSFMARNNSRDADKMMALASMAELWAAAVCESLNLNSLWPDVGHSASGRM